jgi:DNA-directed RNA polymerase specialized sigma24 family protein
VSGPVIGRLPSREVRADLQVIRAEQMTIVRRVLLAVPARDRELLIRFYLREEDKMEICKSMGLSLPQFRNDKSRALANFSRRVVGCFGPTVHAPKVLKARNVNTPCF